MELLLEPALTHRPETTPESPGQLAGHSLNEWNDAYEKVEWYFHALRVRNKLLRGEIVVNVVKRAMSRAAAEPGLTATELAVREMDRVVNEWFAEVLEASPAQTDDMLSTRGRLALLLADMPEKWQDQFLRPPPWPEEFIAAMREAYLRAGPDFQVSQMFPRPLDLGPITTLTNLSRLPVFKYIALASWALIGFVLLKIFFLTH
jgi:hypothetical protein